VRQARGRPDSIGNGTASRGDRQPSLHQVVAGLNFDQSRTEASWRIPPEPPPKNSPDMTYVAWCPSARRRTCWPKLVKIDPKSTWCRPPARDAPAQAAFIGCGVGP
jgi:hypothetical protein